MKTFFRHAALFAVLIPFMTHRADAAITLVLDPNELTLDGTVKWPGTSPNLISNPVVADVDGLDGLTLTMSTPDALYFRRIAGISWTASAIPDFTELVWSTEASGPATLMFNSDVRGLGFYIEAELIANTTFSIDAYDALDNLLGSVSQASTLGLGIFMGVRSDAADIRYVQVNSSFDPSFVLGQPIVMIPEPSTWLLGGLGALLVFRRASPTRLQRQ